MSTCRSHLRRKLDRVDYSGSALSLFFAVDMDLRAAGLDSGNFWFYDHDDLDELYRRGPDAATPSKANRRRPCSSP